MSTGFPRRRFLQTAAAGGLLAIRLEADLPDNQAPVPPSDQVRFGIIGVGMQGSGLSGSCTARHPCMKVWISPSSNSHNS
jgi:hypothetical protein